MSKEDEKLIQKTGEAVIREKERKLKEDMYKQKPKKKDKSN